MKGKRIRKSQTGISNKGRWKYLSADVSDVLDKQATKLRAKAAVRSKSNVKPQLKVGYDIDGDGFVDVREMRLAKFLDAMVLDRQKDSEEGHEPAEADLLVMRQNAGRLLIAKEFVERNRERLWRYGSIFTGMNDNQAAEFIATHKNFKKLVPFLESTERNRTVRSSHQIRTCIHGEVATDALPNDKETSFERQTWIETTRKVRSPSFSRNPLPDLHPKKKPLSPSIETSLSTSASSPEVFTSANVIDDDGAMKDNLRLQSSSQDNKQSEAVKARHQQQLEARKRMVTDFVQRNADQMWLYDASFRDKSVEQIVDEIASSAGCTAEFNRLRTKERIIKLTSSQSVAGCIVQLPPAELRTDPSNATEFRRVKDRSELLMARKELLKPLQQRRGLEIGDGSSGAPRYRPRGIREEHGSMGRSQSDGCLLIGLPRIYDAPVKIEPISSFSVTKWCLDS